MYFFENVLFAYYFYVLMFLLLLDIRKSFRFVFWYTQLIAKFS